MHKLMNVMVAGVIAFAAAGCSTGPSTKPGFATAEKDGKLYVFPYDSPEYRKFMETGAVDKPVTAIGAGPNGETVVSSNQNVLHRYLGW